MFLFFSHSCTSCNQYELNPRGLFTPVTKETSSHRCSRIVWFHTGHCRVCWCFRSSYLIEAYYKLSVLMGLNHDDAAVLSDCIQLVFSIQEQDSSEPGRWSSTYFQSRGACVFGVESSVRCFDSTCFLVIYKYVIYIFTQPLGMYPGQWCCHMNACVQVYEKKKKRRNQ